MAESILVTGGAGYIGSVVVALLLERGYQPVVYDDLSHGHREALSGGAQLVVGDIGDHTALERVFAEHRPQAVMHFAALIEAGESMQYPERYFRNNTASALTLLETILKHNGKRFVFPSPPPRYGTRKKPRIEEGAPLHQSNANGK